MTPNRGVSAGDRPGWAPAIRAAELAGASSPARLHLFAPGTPASAAEVPDGPGGPSAAVDALAATLGCPSRAAGVVAVEVDAVATAVVETEAPRRRPGTAADPAAQLARGGRPCVGRRVDAPADIVPANPSTPPRTSMAVPWR